jgi:imidazoleglycerol-phosphate dehydratase
MARADPPATGARRARRERATSETDVTVEVDLDRRESVRVDTTVPFFSHVLEAMAFHGGFELQVRARGDEEVDPHHLVEDVGLVLGDCLRAVRDLGPVRRFASALIPMDDALAEVAVDVGGRPYLHYAARYPQSTVGTFEVALVREFLGALATRAQINLHATVRHGENAHHMVEALFKALGRALAGAYAPATGGMSTKGRIG